MNWHNSKIFAKSFDSVKFRFFRKLFHQFVESHHFNTVHNGWKVHCTFSSIRFYFRAETLRKEMKPPRWSRAPRTTWKLQKWSNLAEILRTCSFCGCLGRFFTTAKIGSDWRIYADLTELTWRNPVTKLQIKSGQSLLKQYQIRRFSLALNSKPRRSFTLSQAWKKFCTAFLAINWILRFLCFRAICFFKILR